MDNREKHIYVDDLLIINVVSPNALVASQPHFDNLLKNTATS